MATKPAFLLAFENLLLKQKLSDAQKQLQREPEKELPAHLVENLARNLEALQDALGK